MIRNKEVIAHLLTAPNSQLDASMLPLISSWSTPPTAMQILEVLDKCIVSSLASSAVIMVFQLMLNEAMADENTTLETLREKATWRESRTND